jgi:hypothetical protein
MTAFVSRETWQVPWALTHDRGIMKGSLTVFGALRSAENVSILTIFDWCARMSIASSKE